MRDWQRRISARALKLAGEAVEPGVTTGEIDRMVRRYIEGAGSYSLLPRIRRVSGKRLYFGQRGGHPWHTGSQKQS